MPLLFFSFIDIFSYLDMLALVKIASNINVNNAAGKEVSKFFKMCNNLIVQHSLLVKSSFLFV